MAEAPQIEVPAAIKTQLAWVLGRSGFAVTELATAFPAEPEARLAKLVADLERMGLLDPAD